MGKYIISGGNRLRGEVHIEGAKNAILPVLAATIIHEGKSIIHNCPLLKDVETMKEILLSVGCKVTSEGSTIIVDASSITSVEIPDRLVTEMRSSIIVMGSMLTRLGKVKLSFPGG